MKRLEVRPLLMQLFQGFNSMSRVARRGAAVQNSAASGNAVTQFSCLLHFWFETLAVGLGGKGE